MSLHYFFGSIDINLINATCSRVLSGRDRYSVDK